MRPQCACYNDHRLPTDSVELDRVLSLMESWTSIRKQLQESRPRQPLPDILFWNRKLQVARAESIQKLKVDLCGKKKQVPPICRSAFLRAYCALMFDL